MRWTPRAVRVGVVVSLGLPAFVILMAGSLQAQFPKGGPKIPQPPPFPKFEQVWICPNFKCKKEIGKPPAPPPATCPFCGTKILNGVGPANPINPQPNPTPPPAPPPMNPNPGQQSLAGTWSGSETLAGYGALTFQLQPGGQANMLDKDGNTPGTWSLAGNSVTINFPGIAVFYSGSLNGNQISGTARNGKDNWNWTVSNPQFNQAAKPPVNPPPPVVVAPAPPPPSVPANPNPPVAQPPRAEQQNAADNPRPSRFGVIAIIGGLLFLLLGAAVVGGGIFFIVKAMNQETPRRERKRRRRD